MKTAVILATGPSMSAQLANSVHRKGTIVIAVSDAYRLAPWADALVSQDLAWWNFHKEALDFAGRKFRGPDVRGTKLPGVEIVEPGGIVASGTNSALLATHVAVTFYEAEKVLLLGVHMSGGHFFGQHPAPLKNTTPARFEVMKNQFERYKPRGVKIFNCTPGSELKAYPFRDLCDALHG